MRDSLMRGGIARLTGENSVRKTFIRVWITDPFISNSLKKSNSKPRPI